MASWGTLPLVCPPVGAAPLSPSQMQSVLLSSPDSRLLRVPDPPVWREGREEREGREKREGREGREREGREKREGREGREGGGVGDEKRRKDGVLKQKKVIRIYHSLISLTQSPTTNWCYQPDIFMFG